MTDALRGDHSLKNIDLGNGIGKERDQEFRDLMSDVGGQVGLSAAPSQEGRGLPQGEPQHVRCLLTRHLENHNMVPTF